MSKGQQDLLEGNLVSLKRFYPVENGYLGLIFKLVFLMGMDKRNSGKKISKETVAAVVQGK